jgi:hypothetical protein
MPGARVPGSAASGSGDHIARPPEGFDELERQRIAQVQPVVEEAARKHGIKPSLIYGVIWVESRFQPRAKSSAGARGLMQLMPATASALARQMGRHRANSYDPQFNVHAGTLYLAKMLEHYDGDVRLALSAYNAGAGNVDRWTATGDLPPHSQRYVALVRAAQARFEAWQSPAPGPAPAPAEPTSKTMIAEAGPRTQAPAPAVAPSGIETPVRYDLDRVESTYTPEIPPEPPLRDTPFPPREERVDPALEQLPTPAPTEPRAPASATAELPSVLD